MSKLKIFVGTKKGLFTINGDTGRQNWTLEEPQMKGWEINNFCRDTRGNTDRLYATVSSYVFGPTIHYSDDFGTNWTQLENNPRYPQDSEYKVKSIWTVECGHDSEEGFLYTGVDEGGMFASADAGQTWMEVSGFNNHSTRKSWYPGNGGLCLHTIIQCPHDSKRIYAGISAVGMFRSDDGGQTWNLKNNGIPQVLESEEHKDTGFCVHKLVIDPDDSSKIYRQDHVGVFRSHDAGDNWERVEEGLPCHFGFPIVMDPNTRSLFIIPFESDEYRIPKSGAPAVYKSTNRGEIWEAKSNGLPKQDSYITVLRDAMAVDALDPCGVYFGSTQGKVYVSSDIGENWTELPFHLPRIQGLKVYKE